MESSLFFLLARIHVAGALAILMILLGQSIMRNIVGRSHTPIVWSIAPLAMIFAVIPPCILLLSPPSVFASGWVTNLVVSSRDTLVIIWAIGAISMLAWLILQQKFFLKSADLNDAITIGQLRLVRSNHNDLAPFVCGVFSKKLVLPKNFAHQFSRQERSLLLSHERCHLQSADLVTNGIAWVIVSLNWFNPIYYLGVRKFQDELELACDHKVTDNAQTLKPLYADLLLRFQMVSDDQALNCNWTRKRPHHIHKRITQLESKPPKPVNVVRRSAIVLLSLFLTIAVTWSASWSLQTTLNPRNVVSEINR